MDIKTFIRRFNKKMKEYDFKPETRASNWKDGESRGMIYSALYNQFNRLEFVAIIYYNFESGEANMHNIIPVDECISNYILRYVGMAINAGLYGEKEGE